MRWNFLFGLIACSLSLSAQTIGRATVFNFLNSSPTPQLTALGGVNVSDPSPDIGLAENNPALLRSSMHAQLGTSFARLPSGINAWNLALGYLHPKTQTRFLWSLAYLDYGSITETDAAGNSYGSIRPRDWYMQVSAAHDYAGHWTGGASLKFISSNYGLYRSNGIAVDVGLLYRDSVSQWMAGLLVRNMGTQLRKYDGTDPGDLPFDLQLGISKKLAHAPFAFSFTAHHLHQFALTYNDTAFNNENGWPNAGKGFTLDKLFRHFVLATTVFLGDRVTLTAGYNHLRRQELSLGRGGNGLTGFSLGAAVVLDKMQIRFSRSQYMNRLSLNQFGLNLPLNKYFGLGKWGDRVGW